MYAKIEAEGLRFIRMKQKKLRVENYVHLRDAMNNDGDAANVGQLVILPSSFIDGPHYMHERTQDAMTYVQNCSCPDLFITFTCNPAWVEVANELMLGQKPQDWHDLLPRVFRQKVKALMNLINKGKIFGAIQCYMYTTEWQ
ncbi:hypothetical protein Y1Q_0012895 [Alligator mississippiensis]|uniref:Helitron helicase-like domain-containing protein n=1 Tax=Alligator mississippiensis TaxID=8496 RepID=A0A151P4F2_ALLMI|nr:hypothetical protein Y1Q_0012895 [Alligator mississippiensis]